jgi:hypothetical protein
MDQTPGEPPDRPAAVEWSPRPGTVTTAWVLVVLLAGGAVLLPTPPGKLLFGLGAVLFLLAALYGSVGRPRLRVDDTGITVRQLFTHRFWPWPTALIRVHRTRRLGREVGTLELDGPDDAGVERLAVLGRIDLGADPADVAVVLRDFRP